MKGIRFLIAALVMSAGMLAPQGLSAQQRTVKVQGQPHELLTRKAASGEWRAPLLMPVVTGSNYSVDFSEIRIWAVERNINPDWCIDSAALIVKWTDGKNIDSTLIWGFRWNKYTVYDNDTVYVTKYGIDMMRAVAGADPRFMVLMQNTGSMGYTIDGIGYVFNDCRRPNIEFDYAGALADSSHIAFHYICPPNYDMGQKACPDDPVADAAAAIKRGLLTGFIEHPFNISYGYPAYDYDYWSLNESTSNARFIHWQAGWYTNGYWSYWVKDNPIGNYSYSGMGASSRMLVNGSVDGWVFYEDFHQYNMSGDYVVPTLCTP
jgi:hypothetical protein